MTRRRTLGVLLAALVVLGLVLGLVVAAPFGSTPSSSPPATPTSSLPATSSSPVTPSSVTPSSSATVPAAPTMPTGRVFGIAADQIIDEPAAQANADLADIASIGFTWLRADFSWLRIQPTEYGALRWDRLDAFVQRANAHGLHVLAILDYAPSWAAAPGCPGIRCAPASDAAFAGFAGTVATHFGTTIGAYEVWNEENTTLFWGGRADPGSFARLLRMTYTAIRLVMPTVPVLIGGLANANASTGIDPVEFLRRLYAAGARGSFDALAYHPYTFPRALHESPSWAKISSLYAVMRAHGDGTKTVWLTEFGAPTAGAEGVYVSPASQATQAASAYRAVQSLPYVRALFWFGYQDVPVAPGAEATPSHFYGLVRTDGQDKPAYDTWRRLLTH